MGWTGFWLVLSVGVSMCPRPSLGAPPQHRGWLRLWEEGEGCGECEVRRCPAAPPGCPAGTVRDSCGCCEQCGNAEGQRCDPDGAQEFYGRCGDGLRCQRKVRRGRRGHRRSDPEPKCTCRSPGPVCGSNGQTYANLCQLREAASMGNTSLRHTGQGPCYSAPRISRAPRDLTNYTGNDITFGCEVSAFPLPNLNWKKKGSNNFLPGDDPHISIQTPSLSSSQARGGPQRYTVSTWLQIQGLLQSDAGVYSCISHNALGETLASASLTVIRQEVRLLNSRPEDEDYYYDNNEESSGDERQESGDSQG